MASRDDDLAPAEAPGAGEGRCRDEVLGGLMAAYQRGSLDSFDELYRQLAGPLRRYLTSLCLSSDKAEDLLQETFLQLHRSRHTYRPPRPVLPWTFGIARFVFLMDRRASRKRPETASEDRLAEAVLAPLATFPRRDLVRRAVAALPLDKREPLLLHHVCGFSFKEIGRLLGIREGTAKVRAHRALGSLRRALGIDVD